MAAAVAMALALPTMTAGFLLPAHSVSLSSSLSSQTIASRSCMLRSSSRGLSGLRSVRLSQDDAKDGTMSRSSALRFLAGSMVASTLTGTKVASAEESASESTEDGQIIDVDKINGKKLTVLGGALVFADILAGLITGRSILRIVGGNEDPNDWKVKVVDKLLEKEKREAAARMGVSVVTESKPRPASSTGEYAKSDPFEIAKQKYKKKESIEDLSRELRKKLDTKPAKNDDDEDD